VLCHGSVIPVENCWDVFLTHKFLNFPLRLRYRSHKYGWLLSGRVCTPRSFGIHALGSDSPARPVYPGFRHDQTVHIRFRSSALAIALCSTFPHCFRSTLVGELQQVQGILHLPPQSVVTRRTFRADIGAYR